MGECALIAPLQFRSIIVGGLFVVRLGGVRLGVCIFIFIFFVSRTRILRIAAFIVIAIDVRTLSLAPQAGFIGLLLRWPAVLELGQQRSDLVEFGSRDDVLVLVRQNLFDILLRHLD